MRLYLIMAKNHPMYPYLFALRFRQFMLVNNITRFSPDELRATGKQINNSLNRTDLNYSSQYIQKLLESYGIKDVTQKYLKSQRHNFWFNRPMCHKTLKVIKF